MKYGLHGKLTATEGNYENLSSLLLEASQLVSTAQGCHLYLVSRDISDENSIWITEVWDTKDDHNKSLQVPGVRELISRAIPILKAAPQKGQELEILGGTGIEF